MVPHPEFRSSLNAYRAAELRAAARPSRHAVRRQVGVWLVAAGSRLAPEAHASRAPRRATA